MSNNEFDSSDEEPSDDEQTPFQVSWLSLEAVNYSYMLGIGPLPGCKFKNIRRSLLHNIEEMKRETIQDVFVLCTLSELSLYRVPTLLQEYRKQGFVVYHYPFLDGDVPQLNECRKMLKDLQTCIDNRRRALIHCFGGLGRSCLIAACLLLQMNSSTTPQETIDIVRSVRGPGAIQTIKQYNFVNEFREKMSHLPTCEEADRALSR